MSNVFCRRREARREQSRLYNQNKRQKQKAERSKLGQAGQISQSKVSQALQRESASGQDERRLSIVVTAAVDEARDEPESSDDIEESLNEALNHLEEVVRQRAGSGAILPDSLVQANTRRRLKEWEVAMALSGAMSSEGVTVEERFWEARVRSLESLTHMSGQTSGMAWHTGGSRDVFVRRIG
jgi:hypothetical protein